MKSINKSQLTNEELNELIGGVAPGGMGNGVANTNSTATCICTYDNSSGVNNSNLSTGCDCVCK